MSVVDGSIHTENRSFQWNASRWCPPPIGVTEVGKARTGREGWALATVESSLISQEAAPLALSRLDNYLPIPISYLLFDLPPPPFGSNRTSPTHYCEASCLCTKYLNSITLDWPFWSDALMYKHNFNGSFSWVLDLLFKENKNRGEMKSVHTNLNSICMSALYLAQDMVEMRWRDVWCLY